MADVGRLFGNRIRALRRARGLTQAQLAEVVDLSINYISQIETGQASPAFETLIKLAEGLGVDIKALFDFSDMQQNSKNKPKDR